MYSLEMRYAFLFALVFAILGSASASAAPLEKDGRVVLRIEEGDPPRTIPFLVDKNGASRIADLPSGARSGDILRDGKIQPSSQRFRGQRGFALVSIGWPGAPATPIDPEEYAPLTNWSEEASDGRWRWDPVRVFQFDLPKQPACNDWSWARATRQKLASMGYKVAQDFGALGIVLPSTVSKDCVPTAYAYLGCLLNNRDLYCGLSVYSHQYTKLRTVIHELGHTLGLEHAQSAPCDNGQSLSYAPWSCRHKEYGDRWDPMGTSFASSAFHAAYSQQLGWIDRQGALHSVPLVGSTEQVVLQPYAGRSGTRALEIALPPSSVFAGGSPGKIYAEYRGRTGLDEVLWSGPSACSRWTPRDHLFLRYVPTGNGSSIDMMGGDSYFLDMTPETEDNCDGGLPPGSSWTDPSGQTIIRFAAIENSQATVEVSTPTVAPGSVRLRLLDRKRFRGKRVRFQIRSNRPVDNLTKSDIQILRGRCLINLWGMSSDYYFKTAEVSLYRCKPGKIQIGLRAGALQDEYLLPSSGARSPVARLLPFRKKKNS